MIYEGMTDDAMTCIKAIRDRFDGSRRNPFSEPECGHHYARSMASWAAVLAMSDFHYSGVDRRMHFTSVPGTYFWSNGYAWGTCKVETDRVTLSVLSGLLDICSLSVGDNVMKNKTPISEGEAVVFKMKG